MALSPTTLVIGASGTVGSELSRRLAERGHRVLRATSKPAAVGQVRLDLVSGEGVAAAFAGVDRAFLLAPPGHVNQHELLVPAIEAARAQGVKKLVLMSAMGANASDELPLRRAELALIGSGLAWNVIRPNWFMQNFHTFWLEGIRTQGKIQLPVGRAKGSFIDARDIAAVAAHSTTSHSAGSRQACRVGYFGNRASRAARVRALTVRSGRSSAPGSTVAKTTTWSPSKPKT